MEASLAALPTNHVAGDPPQAQLSIRLKEPFQPPSLHLSFPAPQAGVCRWQGVGRSGKKCQESQDSGGGVQGRYRSSPCPFTPLHRGLTAEHNLQVLSVELPCLGQGHDTLPVGGELLDVHLLGGKKEVRAGLVHGLAQRSLLPQQS